MCSETPLLSCNLPGIEHSSRQFNFNAMAVPNHNEVTVKAKCEPSFEAEATDTPPATAPQLKPLSWVLVMIALLTSLFLFALDNTIVANVQPDIIGTLGEIEKLPWVSVAFALGGIATDLPWGQVYGHFENKSLFLGSVLVFEVGSAVCGAAPTLNAFIIGRAICGVGGMGIYLGVINMVSALTTEVQRPMYMGLVGLTWGIGTILGPIIGGAFADNSAATWRWSFYINLCIGGAVAPIYVFVIPRLDPRAGPAGTTTTTTLLSRTKSLDALGGILSAGAITTLIMGISFGGSLYAWKSATIIALFITSLALWSLFVAQQAFSICTSPSTRLFPTPLLRHSPEMNILFVQMALAQIPVMLPIYFLPLLFQFAKGDSALQSGVHLLPFVLILVFAVMLNGALMAQFGFYMPWYLLGSILALVGSALLYTISAETSTARIFGYSVLTAFGAGLYSQAGFAVAQVKVPSAQLSQAVAYIGVGQIGGIALALTLAESIFLNQATARISTLLPEESRSDIQAAILGAKAELFGRLGAVVSRQVLDAIVRSLNDVFVMMIVASGLSVLLAGGLKRERLFGLKG
ncbi:efflux pump antibiotic resistance protein [Aspergillus pseudoustus]|uniref:Efflux pump antibiotic resistance protein n=1 Tax=Aspergillus pseudoustus TaxID=1810923 RepID=A0ABR4J368_9EURO